MMFIIYILICFRKSNWYEKRRKNRYEEERLELKGMTNRGALNKMFGRKEKEKKRKAIPQQMEGKRREEEVGRRDSGKEEGRIPGSKARLCEARQAVTTGCAYFMAATYHKSLPLMGERRSYDFKEITCRTRPTYTQPC